MAGVDIRSAFEDSTVLLTGHTGFKGAWLSLWLDRLGATVVGYALDPPTDPSLFEVAKLGDTLTDVRGDVADLPALEHVIRHHRPDYVFHLAALPIVRASYEAPVETFATNVMGTVHLLEAIRRAQHPCTIIVVTSDKCYLDRSRHYGYREEDALGGSDPYSASKSAQELVTASYRHSYFALDTEVRLASARAGNVVGGGDWACDRLVPDAVRALTAGDELVVRNPTATRPWQHVLQPLSGYLVLGAAMSAANGAELAGSWNFGPDDGAHSVGEVADLVVREWGEGGWHAAGAAGPPESGFLALAVDKARNELGWRAVWDVQTTISRTVAWYRAAREANESPTVVRGLCEDDIAAFELATAEAGFDWF